jgi:transcriptional regulator of acetoin/glycerol metabolism
MASGESTITREHLSDDFLADAQPAPAVATPVAPSAAAPSPRSSDDNATLEALALETIRRALDEAGGNISAASKRLGISRNTIYRRLRWKQP